MFGIPFALNVAEFTETNVKSKASFMKLCVTGASGFVGRALCKQALCAGLLVRAAVRSNVFSMPGAEVVWVGDICDVSDWGEALDGCDVVVHLAARAHVKNDKSSNPLQEFRNANVDATLNLARQAAAAGIKRFVFISSIGVNGTITEFNPFGVDDEANPHSFYAVSKLEAEVALRTLANETSMDVVIIRPPLVYGANAPGNFGALMRWVGRGFPLPLGGVTSNRRSFVALDNLVDLILTCVNHPDAGNQTFLVSDGNDMSTAEFLQRIERAIQRPVRLFYVPVSLLKFLALILGKSAMAQSLLNNCHIDISHTRKSLGWKPSISVNEGLRRTLQGLGE